MQPSIKTVRESIKLFTNSIIHIDSDFDPTQLLFQWKRCPLNHHHPLSSNNHSLSSSHQYVCTPLDYNSIIELKVGVRSTLSQCSHQQQSFSYGPIFLEQQLIHKMQAEPNRNEYYGFIKNSVSREEIKIVFSNKKVQIHSTQLLFECIVIQQKQQPNLIKIQNESNTYILHLYVGDNHNQGQYVRIQFDDRLERDALICKIMELNGVNIKEIKKQSDKNPRSSKTYDTPTFPKTTTFSNKDCIKKYSPQKKNTKLLKMKTLQKDINELLNDEDPRDQEDTDQIMKDIYDILYTPQNSTGSLSPQKRNKGYLEEVQLTKTVKNRDYLNSLTSCKSLQGFFNENLKGQKEVENEEEILSTAMKKRRVARTSLIDRLSLEERVKYLTEANITLIKDNQQLVEENRQLKHQNTLNKEEISKIRQMKQMIASLVHRITYLEGFNQGNFIKNQREKGNINSLIFNKKSQGHLTRRQSKFKVENQKQPTKQVFLNRQTLTKKEGIKSSFYEPPKHERYPNSQKFMNKRQIQGFYSPSSAISKKVIPEFKRFPKVELEERK